MSAKPVTTKTMLDLALRLGLGGLWIYAGAMKVADPQQFFEDIRNYRLVSSDVAMLMAVYLPWLEIAVGLALMVGRAVLGAALLSAVLAAVFFAAIASAWARGLDITCGCFGSGEGNRTNYPLHLAMNVGIALAAGAILWMRRGGGVRKQSAG